MGGRRPQDGLSTQRPSSLESSMNFTNRSRQLRKNRTEAEQKMWSLLRGRQIAGHKFRFQSPIGQYIVDFVCHDKRLIVEIDGGQHQLRTSQDATRTSWLQSQGYRVLRFWNNEVLSNSTGVIETIHKALEPEN